MEEIINLFSSISKISLISFFVTLVLLFYQIYLFKKEIKKKKARLTLPEFKEDLGPEKSRFLASANLNKEEKNPSTSFAFFFEQYLNFFYFVFCFFFCFCFEFGKKQRPSRVGSYATDFK